MKISLMGFISVVVLSTVFTATAYGQGQQWLWVSTKSETSARHLSVKVSPVPEETTPNRATFRCDIPSDFSYRGATVLLRVRDEKGTLVSDGALPLDISAGANVCTISLDTTALPLGSYEAEFSISHALLLSDPTHVLTLRNVNSANLVSELDAAEARSRELSAALEELETESTIYPYLRLKVNIVEDVLASARANVEQEAWESVEAQLRYGTRNLIAIHAGMIFGSTASERSMSRAPVSQADMLIQDGAFMAGTQPVFLFGGALPEADMDSLKTLERYQLNAATVTLRPSANPAADHSAEAMRAELAPLFEAAAARNLSIAIQLTPDALLYADSAAAPSLTMNGRTDIADPAAREMWEAYLSKVGPILRGQPMLLGVSLAQDPYFYFDDEGAKAGFLDFLQEHYADRITLNSVWRSHLATMEDLQLWSDNPYDTFQSNRPYQFDWQTFHQTLGNGYFQWSGERARAHMPHVPLMVTLPDAPFEPGESVHGVDREKLSDVVQIAACAGVNGYIDPVYAMTYPRQSANYTLLRSFTPDQPVMNLNNTWELPERASGAELFRFVHSAVWEGVMSGMSGATVPMDSLIFQRPDALEAFATAALDVNRLASIVLAFQNAPVDVGVLFSESSKVYDRGVPHLASALHAYEGASFGGYKVSFVTERQINEGVIDTLKIVVIPDTPAISDSTFAHLSDFVEGGGTVARTGAPIPYNERGFSRNDLIRNTGNTVLVRGLNLPTEYLHAMDAASVLGTLPQIPRTVTAQGYPIEGVKTRFVEHEGAQYLYVINLRKEPAYCTLLTPTRSGRDLIQGMDVTFPTTLEPLVPMLIKLNPVRLEMAVTASVEKGDS